MSSRKYFKISKMSLWYYEIFEDIQLLKIHDYAFVPFTNLLLQHNIFML